MACSQWRVLRYRTRYSVILASVATERLNCKTRACGCLEAERWRKRPVDEKKAVLKYQENLSGQVMHAICQINPRPAFHGLLSCQSLISLLSRHAGLYRVEDRDEGDWNPATSRVEYIFHGRKDLYLGSCVFVSLETIALPSRRKRRTIVKFSPSFVAQVSTVQ